MKMPFTGRELVHAMRLLTDDVDDDAFDDADADGEAIGYSYSEDTLVLLSLVSPALEARVHAYLASAGVPLGDNSERDQSFQARRAVFAIEIAQRREQSSTAAVPNSVASERT